MTAGPAPLEVRDLTVRLGGLTALDHVSLTVPPRSIVGLIGPNGAGKTTLFDCVTGVRTPAGGRVRLFGRDVTRWPPHRRARLGVGRTFQRLELFGSLTVRQNLLVAIESDRDRGGVFSDLLALPASVETRADAADLADDVLAFTGLRAYADATAGDLPIGLSRVVELARALCGFPRLLLLDEPSSGLSGAEARSLAKLLARLRERGKSLLVVEHNMSFLLGLADHVYVLDFGRLLAEGTPDDVRSNPAVGLAYLGDQEVTGDDAPSAAPEREHAAAARR